ncbi:MAG: YegP family protein [Actinobacteria bacterium]|nr:YegP family protein [Actinomycetota bacterium]
MAAEFEVYKDKAGEYRWRLQAGNNEIVASGEGYKAKASCLHGIDVVKKIAAGAPINDLTQ